MRIAVYGAGGVGGYFGARLAEAGEEVALVARGEHLAAIRRGGLAVESSAGDVVVEPALATGDPLEVGEVDAVILGVKAWQLGEAAEAIRPMMGEGGCVLPLQNGVDAPGELAAVLGEERVLGGLCRIISRVAEPGRIVHGGVDPEIVLGELDGHRSARAEGLAAALSAARGVSARIADDIRAALWEKFLLIAPTSGVGAVTRAPVGVVRRLPETRALLQAAMAEVAAVATAHGVALADDVVERTMAFVDGLPPEGTASMQRDLMARRPSELESQNGAVVRLGREAGTPTPIHEVLYAALLPAERVARGDNLV